MLTNEQVIEHARICAKAVGLKEVNTIPGVMPCVVMRREGYEEIVEYNPLVNDEQLIALIKRYSLWIDGNSRIGTWCVGSRSGNTMECTTLNEAVVRHVFTLHSLGALR